MCFGCRTSCSLFCLCNVTHALFLPREDSGALRAQPTAVHKQITVTTGLAVRCHSGSGKKGKGKKKTQEKSAVVWPDQRQTRPRRETSSHPSLRSPGGKYEMKLERGSEEQKHVLAHTHACVHTFTFFQLNDYIHRF